MKFFKTFINIIKIMILLITIGFILNYIAYKLPTKNVEKNILNTFEKNTYYLEKKENNYVLELKRTEFIMLTETLLNVETPLINSVKNYRLDTTSDFIDKLYRIIYNKNDSEIFEYSRYWHGYVFPLKTLLSIFTITDLKFINYFFQNLCIIIISIILYKHNSKKYILSYVSSIFLMFPFFTSQIFSQSIILNLTLIFSIILLLIYKKIKHDNIKFFFLIIGGTTSYFDFFTYPLVCVIYLVLLYSILNKNFKFKNIIIMLTFFFIGYSIMWSSKWIISDIILKENNISNIFKTIVYRSSNYLNYKYIGIKNVLSSNFKYYLNTYSFFIIFVNFIYLIIELILSLKNKNFSNIKTTKIISYIFLSILPIIWYIFIREHSYEHPFFSYRLLTITFLAFNFMILNMLKTKIER